MKLFVLTTIFMFSFTCFADLTKESCETKVKAAILAGTGNNPVDPNVLIYLCQGIIEEIKQNAVVEVEVGSEIEIGIVK